MQQWQRSKSILFKAIPNTKKNVQIGIRIYQTNKFFFQNENETVPDKLIIIDWQAGIVGSPLADICQYLFYCCSGKELEHLDDLLKLYYDTLSKKLKELGSDPQKCFTWEDCKRSFERYAPLAIAGVPISSRMCFKTNVKQTVEFAETIKDGNMDGIFGDGLTDPEKYFERIDGILKFAVERKLVWENEYTHRIVDFAGSLISRPIELKFGTIIKLYMINGFLCYYSTWIKSKKLSKLYFLV